MGSVARRESLVANENGFSTRLVRDVSCRSSSSAPVAAAAPLRGRRGRGGGRLDVVATTGRRPTSPAGSVASASAVTGLLPPNADPHDYEVRPDDVKALAARRPRRPLRRRARRVARRTRSTSAGTDAPQVARSPADVAGSTAPTRTGGRTRATRSAPSRRSSAALVEADAHRRGATARPRGATGRLEAARPRGRALHRRDPGAERTLVTTHDSLGVLRAPLRARVVGAVIPSRSTLAQPSAGEIGELVQTIRARTCKAIFAESSVNPTSSRRSRDEAGARIGARCGPTRSGPRAPTAPLRRARSPRTPRAIVDGLSGGARYCRPRPDGPRAPYVQRALLRDGCCSPCPPACSGRLDRAAPAAPSSPMRSARRGSRAGARRGLGDRGRRWRRWRAALGFGVAQEGLARAPAGWAPDAATGLLLVGALARRDGPRLGRRGVGRRGRHDAVRLADRAQRRGDGVAHRAVAASAWRYDAAMRRAGSGPASRPAAPARSGVRPARADRAAARRDRGHRRRRPRRGRGAARGGRARGPGGDRAAAGPTGGRSRLGGRRGWRPSRGSRAVWLADALDVGGRPGAGGARRERVRRRARPPRCATRARAEHERAGSGPRPLRRLRAAASRRSRDVSFAPGVGQIVGMLGPNGGGKTTLFRALLGRAPHPPRRGSGCPAGRPTCRRRSGARLDFPVSALDVALMGAYARTPWYRRRGSGATGRGGGGAGARGARGLRGRWLRRRSPAGSASAC